MRLTQAAVSKLEPTDDDKLYWDSELKGFGCRVSARGKATYVVQYRNPDGRTRRMSLGSATILNATDARKMARKALADVLRGEDPAQAKSARRAAPTVADLAALYLREHASRKSSESDDRSYLERRVLPRWGSRPVASISRADVVALFREYTAQGAPVAANRMMALLRTMFGLAETEWEMIPPGTNPARAIRLNPEKSRDRFLTHAEMVRFGEALRRLAVGATPTRLLQLACLRLLLLTAARKDEIRTLRWADVDLGEQVLRLDQTKTGAKTVALSGPAVAVLAGLPKASDYVFAVAPGAEPVSVKWTWTVVCREAGLANFRLHDLRHTCATWARAQGAGPWDVMDLLGHRSPHMTKRYSHSTPEGLREVADQTGAAIVAHLDNAEPAEVVELEGRRRG